MSGPKISVYSLTGRARTIVVGQMRCEQQSLGLCMRKRRKCFVVSNLFHGSFEQQMSNIRLLNEKNI
jgi:hypothetical protein